MLLIFHDLIVQIQQWLDNSSIKPTDWGWIRGDDGCLIPLTTTDPVAPEAILCNIFCRCGIRCGCRKAGINCSMGCVICQGSCTNCAPVEDLSEHFQNDPNVDEFDLYSPIEN